MNTQAVDSTPGSTRERRYDLDWLRVIAFGLLILYHVGMFYVADWGWHVKSPDTSAGLQTLMYLTNPWRMSLLFLVSGMALRFACVSLAPRRLIGIRNRRLLLPLVFSMLVIVPPQLWVELTTGEGMNLDYLSFMAIYVNVGTVAYPEHQHGPLGLWTWNHLWFLAYLWIYTFVFVACKPLLDRVAGALDRRGVAPWLLIVAPILMLTVYRQWLSEAYPPSNALVDDWYNHARYLSFLLGGYVLAQVPGVWTFVSSRAWYILAVAVLAYLVLLTIAGGEFHDALSLWLPGPLVDVSARIAVSVDQWLWILAALGLGHRYLNRSSAVLRYMNVAILPWYMLHQTIIVLLAYSMLDAGLAQPLEAAVILGGTVLGCALGYEIVKRFALGRLLFGLNSPGRDVTRSTGLGVAGSAAP